MAAFREIEGEFAIIATSGVFKQVGLYERNGLLYAATAGGYVQLYENATTSKDKVRLVELSFEGEIHKTMFGKLCIAGVIKGSQPIDDKQHKTLLLGSS